jgi:hypothetical protein
MLERSASLYVTLTLIHITYEVKLRDFVQRSAGGLPLRVLN